MSLERVGRDLLDRSDAIAARAVALLDSHRVLDRVLVEDATVVLCDRLALSLALSRPVGLRMWGMRESEQLGRVVALDVVCACVEATFGEVDVFGDYQEVHFLETLRDTTIDAVLGSIPPSNECDDVAEILSASLGARDVTMCEHSRARVVWTRCLCMAMGIDAANARFPELCALVHDVDKIALPDSVRNVVSAFAFLEAHRERTEKAGGIGIAKGNQPVDGFVSSSRKGTIPFLKAQESVPAYREASGQALS